MNIIQDKRQTGRTTKLLNLLIKNKQSVMIVIHEHERTRLLKLHPVIKGRIFTWYEFITDRLVGRRFKEIYFDNLDYMLQSVTGISTAVVTIEGDD